MMHRCHILALLFLLLSGGLPDLALAGAEAWQRAPRSEPLSAGLVAAAEEGTDRIHRVWVFFTDKQIFSQSEHDLAAQAFRQSLGADARARRALVSSDLAVDFYDLPVVPEYVAEIQRAGAQVLYTSRWMNAAAIRVPASRLRAVASLEHVHSVRPILIGVRDPDPVVEALEQPIGIFSGASVSAAAESLFYGASYAQNHQIGVRDLHRLGYTGAGVKVMMLDTGFKKDHPAFTCANLVWEYDYVSADGNTQNEGSDPAVQHTHGTGTWGVLGSYAPGTLIGPAFGADFYLAKTEDTAQEVQAEEQNYVAALEAADLMGVEVTSASLAYWMFDNAMGYGPADMDGETGVITQAVDIAVGKGIACVNSMGNAGPSPTTLGTPADADSVIAVGAVDVSGSIASFSSRGPTADARIKPEIVARGVSTVWARASGGFGFANGTSLSAPLIGGLCALLKEAHPTWTGADIRAALMGTGTLSGTPNNAYGSGIAQGVAALNFGGGPIAPPRSTLPFVLVTPTQTDTMLTANPKLVWCRSGEPTPGDVASYTVVLSTSANFTSGVTTWSAGTDTCWVPVVGLTPGVQYWWRVEATGLQGYSRKSMNTGTFVIAASVAVDPPAPAVIGLRVPRPNPTRSGSTFSFALPAESNGVLEIIAIDGSLVQRFDLGSESGMRSVVWDGRTEAGVRAPAGVYFVRLISVEQVWTHKLTLLP